MCAFRTDETVCASPFRPRSIHNTDLNAWIIALHGFTYNDEAKVDATGYIESQSGCTVLQVFGGTVFIQDGCSQLLALLCRSVMEDFVWL